MPLAPSALTAAVAFLALVRSGEVESATIALLSVVLAILGGALAGAGGFLKDGRMQQRGLGSAGAAYFIPAVIMGTGEPLEMYAVLVSIMAGSSIVPAGWRFHHLLAAPTEGTPAEDAIFRSLLSYVGRMAAAATVVFLASVAVLNLSLTTSAGYVDPITAFAFGLTILASLAVLATRHPLKAV